MRPDTRSHLAYYGAALGFTGVATLVAELFRDIFEGAPFLPFITAVVLSACIGGFLPGLVSTIVGALAANYLLMPPPYALTITGGGDVVRLGLFVLVSLIISVACSIMHSHRHTAELRARDLQISEERYRRIVETTHEGIWNRDAEGRITYINPRMAQLLGYESTDLLGRLWWDFLHEEDRPAAHHSWERRRQGVSEQCEFRFRRKDGSGLWTIISTSPIFDEEGRFLGALGMLTDITQRKHAEESLRRVNEGLEARVVERTAEIQKANAQLQVELAERLRTEEELRQARLAAEAANLAKSAFLANVSHEIRNPMQIMLTMTDLLDGPERTGKQAEYLQMLKAAASSLLTVINDLLDFSKIEAGKLDLEKVPFNLGYRLGEVLKAQALRAHSKGLELACSLGPEVPEIVVGDPNRLGQLLTNLIGNAIKFTSEGEVIVRVDAVLEGAEEIELQVAVTDTGIGIPADKFQTIFQPFAQADSSTTRKFGGTGLGLSIAARLAALMGGRIWVESEVGRGSTFHFTAWFGLTQSTAAGLIQVRLAGLRDLPVLIVDANATNRGILVETLRKWHLRPAAAAGGRAALLAMAQAAGAANPFRLVLFDAHLPDLDGLAMAAEIRQQPALPAMIAMLSTRDGPAEIARFRELGISAWLTKPVLPSELRASLFTVLGRQPVDQEQGLAALPSATHSPLRILVTEDNPITQVLMVDLLEKLGHTVLTASSGREALAALERQPFDVVLMDVEMPDMSGLEITSQIRAREQGSGQHVPIIAVTAHAMTGARERCLRAGMDGYLAKPLQAPELVEAFAELVPAGVVSGEWRVMSADEW